MAAEQDGNDDRDVIFELKAANISGRGVFCETDRPFPLDTAVDIDIVLPLDALENMEGKKAEFRVSGRVIRVSDQGMAIGFDDEFEFFPLEEQDQVR